MNMIFTKLDNILAKSGKQVATGSARRIGAPGLRWEHTRAKTKLSDFVDRRFIGQFLPLEQLINPKHLAAKAACQGHLIPTEDALLERHGVESPTLGDAAVVDLTALAFACTMLTGAFDLPDVGIAEIGPRSVTYSMKCKQTGRELWVHAPNLKVWRFVDTRCQAATMTFARRCLGVPVPEVLAWNNCPGNLADAPYLITEKPAGVRLKDLNMDEKSDDDILKLFDAIARIHATMCKPLPFEGIGCLDFHQDSAQDWPHSEAADLSDPASYCVVPFLFSPSPPFHGIAPELPPASFTTSLQDFWDDCVQREMIAVHIFRKPTLNLQHLLTRKFLEKELWVDDVEGLRHEPDPLELLALGAFVRRMIKCIRFPENLPQDLLQNCLVLDPSVFSNVFVDPDTMQVTAVTDFENATVASFPLSLFCPEEISRSIGAPAGWKERSGAFTQVPYDGEPDAGHPFYNMAVNELAMRRSYKQSLKKYDKRFSSPALWKASEDALKIHFLTTKGWSSWAERRKWIEMHSSSLQ